jgi:hypothetical protein
MNSLRNRSAGSLEEEELGADDSGGLWGMCRLNEAWPISVCVLQAALGEGRPALNKISAEWEQACFSAKFSKTTAWLFEKDSEHTKKTMSGMMRAMPCHFAYKCQSYV